MAGRCRGPVVFVIVFVASGLHSSGVDSAGPYAEYLASAWFGGFIPASMLNARLTGDEPALLYWTVVIAAQLIFWTIAVSTARRSTLAARGWGLFLLPSVTTVAMVAPYRLQTFGVGLAYGLRYYPEAVFFFPIALALAFRRRETTDRPRTTPATPRTARAQAGGRRGRCPVRGPLPGLGSGDGTRLGWSEGSSLVREPPG
jgi:hypothetical protein